MSQEAPTSPLTTVTCGDIDLYCLQCGYNLRGHTGDPRRCPECGHLNPMGDLELPAELISKQLQRMESAPTKCVGAFVTSILWGLSTIYFVLFLEDNPDTALKIIFCGPHFVLLGIWLVNMRDFQSACLHKHGWWDLLLKYHYYGTLLSGLVVLILFAGLFAILQIPRLFSNYLKDYSPFIVFLAILSFTLVIWPIVLIITKLGGRARRTIKKDMDVLQREVAVKLARERLQGELRLKPKRNKSWKMAED